MAAVVIGEVVLSVEEHEFLTNCIAKAERDIGMHLNGSMLGPVEVIARRKLLKVCESVATKIDRGFVRRNR